MADAETTYHVPVLLAESVGGLNIDARGVYVDLTFGGGGHSREILARLSGEGHLYSFDQDEDALRESRKLRGRDGQEAAGNFTFVRGNFRYLKNFLRYHGVERVDGILADLGVSSHHFDDSARGFSFRLDGPLDMRMNQRARQTAADVVNAYDEQRLADLFYLYGELKQSRRIAAAIVRARSAGRIETTEELVEALPLGPAERGGAKKELAKVFQALRIEVNHEMDALREMLRQATEVLRPGGRLAVIAYHSLEDRMVKNLMKTGNCEGRDERDFFGRASVPFRLVNSKVVVPSAEEQERNPRSRSAKLRIAERV